MVEIQKKLMPELRFPEFSYEWSKSSLRETAKHGFSNGVFNDNKHVGSGYRLINVKDMYEGDSINVDNLTLLELSEAEFKRNKVNYGDIFFTRSSIVKEGIAWSNVVLENCNDITFDGLLIKMSLDLNRIDPVFLSKALKNSSVRKQIVARGKTATMTTIGQEDIASVIIYLPQQIEEQQKIAAFLSAVDNKLTHLRRKRELLENYKCGLMQQLFSQQIRFKQEDGSDFPGWEECELGKIGQIFNGLTGKTSEDFGSGKAYVTYKQVFDSSSIKLDKCQFVKINANDNQTKLLQGDILFTTSSETPNEVGFASVLLEQVQELYLNSFCFCLRPYPEKELLPEFSQYLFRSHQFRRKIFPLAQGSTRYNLSKSSFKRLELDIPATKEQQKIAYFLQSVDNKIDAVAKQITQLDTFKTGLLQKLFV